MAFVKVATVSDLETFPLIEVTVNDNVYALCKVDGEFHALDGLCPHQGGPLGQGMLDGARVMCPWHAWEFDCRTGANAMDASERVETFPVKLEGKNILIDVAAKNVA